MSTNPYLADVLSQPDALEEVLRYYAGEGRQTIEAAARLVRETKGRVYLTGMGASLFSCLAARTLLASFGLPSVVEDTSYLLQYGLPSIGSEDLLVIVSQSGESVEAKRLVSQAGLTTPRVVITTRTDSPVARGGNVVVDMKTTSDFSVAIRTYTLSIAVLYLLVYETVGRFDEGVESLNQVGTRMQQAIRAAQDNLAELVDPFDSATFVTFLGRGASIASALEAALLLKEGAKLPAEGMSAAQFRHGAVEVIEPGSYCVLFAPRGSSERQNQHLMNELESYGAHVLAITSSGLICPTRSRTVLCVEAPNEYLSPLVEIIPIQLLAYELARRRGIEPGFFRNTSPVIKHE